MSGAALQAAHKNKYRNKPTMVDGIRFASKAEARWYAKLKLMQKTGAISGLKLQPRFPMVVKGVRVCTYVADFSFYSTGDRIAVDVKGHPTPMFRLKQKLFAVLYPNWTLQVVK